MTGLDVFHLVATVGLGALGVHTLLNHIRLPRLHRMEPAPQPPRISVLIPARNEAERIDASVRGWAAQDYPDYEVIVYDDDSVDDTGGRALRAAEGAPHVRVVRGGPLPAGWRGKPWACHRLRAQAHGEVLVFADADVVPARDTLRRTAGALAALGADALSAVPAHVSDNPAVKALGALQNWAVLGFVPTWLPVERRGHWLAAMTGQFIAIRAEVYDASGGFSMARDSLAEDATLGRRLAAQGYRVRVVDGSRQLRCRSYATVRALWRASARNLLPVFFDSPGLLLLALALLALAFLGPVVVLALGLVLGEGGWGWRWLPLAEMGLGIALRTISDLRAGYGLWTGLLHPLAVAALIAMGVDSLVSFRLRGVVEWRGRRYDAAA
jgi:chlorobactene glucosyltransferase